MSRIYRELPPKGSKLGIAFSGGLDTRAAVAWMSRNGMQVYAYTADLAQPDEKNPADIPPAALTHGAAGARLIDCRDAMAREGVIALQCGAFHLATAGKKYFNTTPLGRAVTATAIVRAASARIEEAGSSLSAESTKNCAALTPDARAAPLGMRRKRTMRRSASSTWVASSGGAG